MVVFEFTDRITSRVPAAKLFKAWASEEVYPIAAPHFVKPLDIVEGTGGPGTIKLVTFADGKSAKFMKYRVDVLDEDNLSYADSPIEGGPLVNEKVEKIHHGVKFESTADGGCIATVFNNIFIRDGVEITEEEASAGRDEAVELFKIIEAYLSAN